MQSEGQVSLRVRIAFSYVFQSTEILDVSFITIPVSDLVFFKFLVLKNFMNCKILSPR